MPRRTVKKWLERHGEISTKKGIDSLLKAKIVCKQRADVRDRIKAKAALPEYLKGHDLYQLTVEAGYPDLAKEEETLLRRLSRCSAWYGRYPVPVTPAALQPSHSSENYDFDISLTQYKR